MYKRNEKVKCDVRACCHNVEGENCCLDTVNVTCNGNGCTCCGDYEEE